MHVSQSARLRTFAEKSREKKRVLTSDVGVGLQQPQDLRPLPFLKVVLDRNAVEPEVLVREGLQDVQLAPLRVQRQVVHHSGGVVLPQHRGKSLGLVWLAGSHVSFPLF